MGDEPQLFIPRVGAVFSADIAVPEHEREVRFYSRVLSTGASPLWRDDLMNNLGLPIIGLGARTPEHADLPLQWMPHIQVADVAESVRRAEDLGGSVLMHAKDDDGKSQWAVLLDPNGAAFGVVPVVPAESMPPVDGSEATGSPDGSGAAAAPDEPPPVGRIAWLDLTVPDADATRDFYVEVVGWSVHDVAMDDGGEAYADYGMVGGDGNAAGGVCHARGKNADFPPVWMIYLPVGDLAESLRRVREEGGEVVREIHGPEGSYSIAVIRDPVGVYLALARP